MLRNRVIFEMWEAIYDPNTAADQEYVVVTCSLLLFLTLSGDSVCLVYNDYRYDRESADSVVERFDQVTVDRAKGSNGGGTLNHPRKNNAKPNILETTNQLLIGLICLMFFIWSTQTVHSFLKWNKDSSFSVFYFKLYNLIDWYISIG